LNAIGIDLGGTWIKGVLMDIYTGEIVKQLYHPTNGEKDWKQAVAETVADLKAHDGNVPVKAIGLSAPGLPNDSNQYVHAGAVAGSGKLPLGAFSERIGAGCE
jgi:glucokinase